MDKSDEIRVGDTAYVYRGCIHCGNTDDLGVVIIVKEITKGYKDGIAGCCETDDNSDIAFSLNQQDNKFLWCLKKIPPLDDLDDTLVDEDMPIETTNTR